MTVLKPYSVDAYNLAKNSENKMHDDSVARRFGFQGGLVPGVDVFAYMTHMPVAKWGRAFLERGLMDGRFFKPVYDGEIAVVTAEETDGGLAIKVESRGELCATGTASMGQSLLATERLRMANEASIRENIKTFLTRFRARAR